MEMPLIHALFEKQVERAPQALAAVCDSRYITYQDLNVQANQLAHLLKTVGVGPGVLVAVYMDRSLDMLPALLGILKAGGAYVPLETTFPPARIQWILSSLQITTLITHQAVLSTLSPVEYQMLDHVICLGRIDDQPELPHIHLWTSSHLARLSGNNLPSQATAQDLAYIIFTSGSTGTPKGVMVCHQPILNLIDWVNTTFQVQASDRILFITSLCFDLSVYDIFGLLAAGGTIHIATSREVHDPERLLQLLYSEPITFWDSAPAALQQLAPLLPTTPRESETERLRLVFLSGDWIPVKLPDSIRRTFHRAQVVSLGGATEASVWSNYYSIGEVDPTWVSIPYGKPIQNARYYVLDAHLQPCPINEPGDLYISGSCLSIGYANDPLLTAEKFLPDPFSSTPGDRMYRTGDLARFWPDGNMEFLGRADQQVKVRGYRIELGEIETVLGYHPAIQDSVVIAHEYAEREKRLAAYLVPDQQLALPIRQQIRFEQEGRSRGRQIGELPNGMAVFQHNAGEMAFLYDELMAELRSADRYGLTLCEGDIVFDVGAHIGLFSLLLGQRYGDVRIYACEPIPQLFELLQLNTALYNIHATLLLCGLSHTTSMEELTYYPYVSILSGRFADTETEQAAIKAYLSNLPGQDASLSEAYLNELLAERLQKERVLCQMYTLSEIIRMQGIEHIDLLKIDAEKSELDVLTGVEEEDWPKIRQVMVEVFDQDHRLEYISNLLRQHGFEVMAEQESTLKNTGLYNLYAIRSERRSEAQRATDLDKGYKWAGKAALLNDVRQFLKERLPEYMHPSSYIFLDKLPLSANGKVDRKALPKPTQDHSGGMIVAPRTPLEQQLTEIWADVLGLEQVSIGDNFFELGGHSLLVTQVITRVRERCKIQVPVSSLFQSPTLATFAHEIETCQKQDDAEIFRIYPVVREGAHHPVAFPQEQIWFLQQLDPENRAYHFQATLTMRGNLNIAVLERCLSEIIRRHEIFRTTFDAIDGKPIQIIHAPWQVRLRCVDLRAIAADERDQVAQGMIAQEFRLPIALDRLPLIRWSLLLLDDQEYILTHVEHHLVHDGWSFNNFLHELLTLYRAYSEAQPSPLPELPVQFVDFVYWQRQWAESAMAHRQLAYWTQQLADSPPLLQLPTDHPRPAIQTFRGDAFRVELSPAQCELLRACCRREGRTLYMVMLALLLTLFYRYTRQEDICLGTGIANRRSQEAERLIGMIINILVLRTDLSGDPTFRDLLTRVRKVTLDAYENQDLPFEKVVEALQPERSLSYNPFFQVIFGFHDSPLDVLELPDLQLELREGLSNGSAKFDLNLIVIPHAEQTVSNRQREANTGITMIWEYNTDLFEAATIQRMITIYQTLLEQLCLEPAWRISQIPLLPDSERRQLLVEWNKTAAPLTSDTVSISRMIEARAAQIPTACAVACGNERLSYQELNQRANQLAHYLCQLGVGAESLVAICLERSPNLVVGLLAILKAGGGYVPLDPDYPLERLTWMLKDSGAGVLLTTQALSSHFMNSAAHIVLLDSMTEYLTQQPIHNLTDKSTAEQLVYMIYTSGSSGQPKGVQITQRGLSNLVRWHQQAFAITARDRVTQIASLSFDAAGWEIWPTLVAGATLCLVNDEIRLAPDKLREWLATEHITVSFLPTPLAERLLELEANTSLLPELRVLLTGGDLLHQPPTCELPYTLINNYGPTESSVVATSGKVSTTEQGHSTPSIGRPIANTRVYLLDQQMQPVPIGVAGELYVSGEGLARGYLGHPDMTAEHFVPDPFTDQPGTRMYKTGDMVRYDNDGNLHFLGRNDEQIKIRGFRVEPGEIETILCRHLQIREAVVVAHEETSDNKRLVAYLVPDTTSSLTPEQIRAYLQSKLPIYMIPSAMIILEHLPLTSNGKLERRSLPVPESIPARKPSDKEQASPRDSVEELLVGVWSEVLGVEQVGIYDNFFELGGHSLLATQVIARIQQVFNVDLPLRSLFEQPRVAEFAQAISRSQGGMKELTSKPISRISQDAVEQTLATLDNLSAEEIDALLSQLLPEHEGL